MKRCILEFMKDQKLSNDTNFKQFVYDEICQCYEQCSVIKGIKIEKLNKTRCIEIYNTPNASIENYDILINKAINYLMDKKLIFKIEKKFYINDVKKLKFNWENIKGIEDDEKKEILWLFRKLIIDCVLKKIILMYEIKDMKIFSVGSNELSSDYDITLYGNSDDKITIINCFNKQFKIIFNEHSSYIFDTNIYGVAYIDYDKEFDDLYVKDDDINAYIIVDDPIYKKSQIVWALVKYLKDIRESFGENIYNTIFEFMNKIPNKFLIDANNIYIYLKNKDELVNYTSLLNKQEQFYEIYNKHNVSPTKSNYEIFNKNERENRLLSLIDFISLANFFGVETYYTRATFIDIVVNNQIKNNKNIIKLDNDDYICSILENAGFYFIHNNKTKYFMRVFNTLDKIMETKVYDIELEYNKLQEIVNKLKGEQTGKINYNKYYCNIIDDNDIKLLKCEKFEIFELLLKIIHKILKKYNKDNDYDSIHLFNNIKLLFNED